MDLRRWWHIALTPSLPKSGKRYQWDELDDWLKTELLVEHRNGNTFHGQVEKSPEKDIGRSRHGALVSYATATTSGLGLQ